MVYEGLNSFLSCFDYGALQLNGEQLMFKRREWALLALTGCMTGLVAIPAQAGGHCHGNCYTKVVSPPAYGTVAERVLVQPERVVTQTLPASFKTVHETVVVREAQRLTRVIPAEYTTVQETVTVRPAQTIARPIPAQHATVHEKVMTSPGGKVWKVTRDAHGREIGCWVHVPPTWGVIAKTVVVRPASVVHETLPAVMETRQRSVLVRPAQIVTEHVPAITHTRARHVMVTPPQAVHHTIPAAYETRHRTVQIHPGSVQWQPVGGGYHRHGHHRHHAY
jgi:hypothetical protein